MKNLYKILNLSFSFCLLSSVAQATTSTTCSPTPDCASLGYVSTKTECEDRGIKCPFGEAWYCSTRTDILTCGDLDIAGEIFARVKTETELKNAINSNKPGIIIIENDITMSPFYSDIRTYRRLKNKQSLVGISCLANSDTKTKPKLTFSGHAGGFVLGNNSVLSDLAIDYYYDSVPQLQSLIINETGRSAQLNNLDITIETKLRDSPTSIWAIQNLGDVTLFGEINMNALKQFKGDAIDFFFTVYNDDASAPDRGIIQDKNSTLNITYNRTGTGPGSFIGAGVGISGGDNILHGTINMTSSDKDNRLIGMQYQTSAILSGNVNIAGSYGIMGTAIISSNIRITVSNDYNSFGVGRYKEEITITKSGQLLIDVSTPKSFAFAQDCIIKYHSGAKIGINTVDSSKINGLWQANKNGSQTVSNNTNTLNWTDFTRIGDFPN